MWTLSSLLFIYLFTFWAENPLAASLTTLPRSLSSLMKEFVSLWSHP